MSEGPYDYAWEAADALRDPRAWAAEDEPDPADWNVVERPHRPRPCFSCEAQPGQRHDADCALNDPYWREVHGEPEPW